MRNRRSLYLTFLSLILICLASTAQAQKITTDYDHSANFSNYHTYAWTEGVQLKNQLMDQRVRDNVDQQLTAKGLQKVDDSAKADLLVSYDAQVTKEPQLNTMGMGGWGRPWGGGMATTSVNYIPVGGLAVNLGDNKTHRLVWRGTASGTLKSKPDQVAQQIQKSVDKMFAKYPPKP